MTDLWDFALFVFLFASATPIALCGLLPLVLSIPVPRRWSSLRPRQQGESVAPPNACDRLPVNPWQV